MLENKIYFSSKIASTSTETPNGKLFVLTAALVCIPDSPNTDDMRDSSSLKMIPWLSKKGAIIKYFDPTGYKNEFSKLKNVTNKTTIKDAIQNSDLVILHTEWNDFKSINFKNLAKGKKFIIFDMRNLYSSSKMKEQGFKYFSVGK